MTNTMSDWTVKRMLAWIREDLDKRGIESACLDGELIVARALGEDRMRLFLEPDRPLTKDELASIRSDVARRRKAEPMAYILGYRDFYTSRFVVSPAVLIPRPDTELLVEKALEAIAELDSARVADLCTGSGCVGLSIAKAREKAGKQTSLVLTDLSADALALTKTNASELGIDATIRQGDLFEPIAGQQFDVITINPPYIAETAFDSLMADVRDFEPKLALVSGQDGRDTLRRILSEAHEFLADDGTLLIEVGHDQGAHFASAMDKLGHFAEVSTHKDLGAIERVVVGRRGPKVSTESQAAAEELVLDETPLSTADLRGESEVVPLEESVELLEEAHMEHFVSPKGVDGDSRVELVEDAE